MPLLFPSNTDLPRSTFRRWLEVKVVPQTSARAVCAECWVVYNLHTLPPYPKNLSPTPGWGPNAIEWSVSRQAAGSIGFVPDTTIFLLFPLPLLHFSHCLALSFPLYTSVPLVADLFLLRFVFCNPFGLVSIVPLLVHFNLQLFSSIQYSIHCVIAIRIYLFLFLNSH